MVCQWLSTVKRICYTLSATYLVATDHCCLAYLVQSCQHLAWDFFVNGRNPDRLSTDDSMYAGNVIHLTYVRDSRGFLFGMGISFRFRTSHSSSTGHYVVVLIVGFIVRTIQFDFDIIFILFDSYYYLLFSLVF